MLLVIAESGVRLAKPSLASAIAPFLLNMSLGRYKKETSEQENIYHSKRRRARSNHFEKGDCLLTRARYSRYLAILCDVLLEHSLYP